eukprot:TRINITY_DN23064_c0_g1_i1.p1 TRINITY_DN23064_c0_g1~~TRINITY_DN23064_c0_g1_i1.p1  ORF type:complete len:778 (+),score=198.88 TRINITY_DN23064_c0_g1_i1:115-2448(+)
MAAEDADATYYPGPLQLIAIDDSGQCHLQENAVSILSQIPGRLAVVSIAGLYRTGKSFLLNRLLDLQDGFEIGPTVNPCTKGLWIWGQPVQLAPDYHIILIDTEGLGSTQRTASCDMQILSLSILLSSHFIYNSMGAIDEQAIDDLHLVLRLAKHIHVKSRKSSNEEEKVAELSQYFPTFLWVLRDFHLRTVDKNGAEISEKEYLESALQSKQGQDDAKNKLRETIKDLFRSRDCVTMVRPVVDEADLRNIQKLPYESLRPQFRTQVEAFVNKVYKSLKPKKIDGSLVSGSMFVNLASEYCKAINNNAVPTIQSAWTSVMQHQLRLSLRDAVQVYRSQMNEKAMQSLPMAEDKLRETHKSAKADALKAFHAPLPKLDADPRFREARAELGARIKQLFDHVKVENASSSQRQCERFSKELYSRQIESKLVARGSYQSFEQLAQDWEQVRRSFLQKTAGPAQMEVLFAWIIPRMLESMQRVWDDLQSSFEDRLRATEAFRSPLQLPETGGRVSGTSSPDRVGEAKLQKADVDRQLEDMRRAAEEAAQKAAREKAQLMDSERTLREQMKILQDRLHSSTSESRRSSQTDVSGASANGIAEIRSLKDSVVAMLSEVRSKDLEKTQLELQSEHEKQLIGLERKLQRQLLEARRKNEGLLETLRQTYEDEANNLKEKNKDLEKELGRLRGDLEVTQHRLTAAEKERTLQQRMTETVQRQSELIMSFLEKSSSHAQTEDVQELKTAVTTAGSSSDNPGFGKEDVQEELNTTIAGQRFGHEEPGF